jgi:integrase/recombinase XerD
MKIYTMDHEKLIKAFREFLKSLEYTKSTITGYSLDIQNYFKWLKDNPKKNIPAFVKFLEKKEFNPKTINHHLFALKHLEDFLSTNKLEKSVKLTGLSDELIAPTYDLNEVEFTKQDIENFISEIKKTGNKRYIALVLLMAKSGLKISEALDIKIENIAGNRIIIKNDERKIIRSARASKEVQEAIKDYLADRKSESPYLFNSNKSDRLDRTVVNRFFKEFNLTPKQLRQYFIIQCLENNKDMADISRFAGIKTIQWIFSRYENMYYDPEKHQEDDSLEIKEIPAKEIIPEVKKAKPKTALGIQLKGDYSPTPTPTVKVQEKKTEPVLKADKKVTIQDWAQYIKDFNHFLS